VEGAYRPRMGQEHGPTRTALQTHNQTTKQTWIFIVCNINAPAVSFARSSLCMGLVTLYRAQEVRVILRPGASRRCPHRHGRCRQDDGGRGTFSPGSFTSSSALPGPGPCSSARAIDCRYSYSGGGSDTCSDGSRAHGTFSSTRAHTSSGLVPGCFLRCALACNS